MYLLTDLATPLIHMFLRCFMQSCSFTWLLMCSTNKQPTLCAALHVSVVMVPPSPSLSMLMLSGWDIISNKSSLLGNSRFVISLQRVKKCFDLSSFSVAKETKTILVILYIYRQANIYISIDHTPELCDMLLTFSIIDWRHLTDVSFYTYIHNKTITGSRSPSSVKAITRF